MESGKRGEAGTSSGVSRGCGGDEEKREEREGEAREKPKQVCEVEAAGEDDDDDADDEAFDGFVPSPLIPLKQQLEKDKEDESLRRWKEKLLGSIASNLNGQTEPEIKFHSMRLTSDDFGEVDASLDADESKIGQIMFTLKEGSHHQFKLKFTVMHNIVSGLTYSNTVWRGGLRVDRSRGMLGTFAPQQEPYDCILLEDTIPTGMLVRGNYSAKLKLKDDDRRCYLKLKYSVEIKKRS